MMLFLRMDEAQRIIKAATKLRDKIIIRLALFSGIQRREIAEARIEHIDPIEQVIWLPKRHWNKDGYACLDTETLTLLTQYVGTRTRGPLFKGRTHGHLNVVRVWQIVKTAALQANVRLAEQCGPRVLRHTFATTWLKNKGNIVLLQKQLGHKHLRSTACYLDFVMTDVRPEYNRIIRKARRNSLAQLIDESLKQKGVESWLS